MKCKILFKQISLFSVILLFIPVLIFSTAKVRYQDNNTETGSSSTVKMYRWPLDIDDGFSSSFQEFRSSHFHAGFDLKTLQETGYPVHAVADGYIYKIRIAKRGSGKSLFMKHDDGNTSIFYHLDHFAPELDALVEKIQHLKKKKYFGYYKLEKPVRFLKDQVIAFTGETGAGFPHLHFELHDKTGAAINPFQYLNIPTPDTRAPILRSLILRNRDSASINGLIEDFRFRFKKNGVEGVYKIAENVIISGDFDMVLEAYDPANSRHYVAPYEISVYVDDILCYHLSFDRFKRDDNNQLSFVYDVGYSNSGWYFFNLFPQKGFALEQKHLPMKDVLDRLETGKHEIRILVKDNFNNQSAGLFSFYKVPDPQFAVSGVTLVREKGEPTYRLQARIDALKSDPTGEIRMIVSDFNGKIISSGLLNFQNLTEPREFVLNGISSNAAYLDFNFYSNGAMYHFHRILLNTSHLSSITRIPLTMVIRRGEVFIEIMDKNIGEGNIRLMARQGGKAIEAAPRVGTRGVYFTFVPPAPGSDQPVLLNFSIIKDNEKVVEIQERVNLIYMIPGVKQEYTLGDFVLDADSGSVNEPRVLKWEEVKFSSRYPLLSKEISLSSTAFMFMDSVAFKIKKNLPKPQQVGIFKYRSGGWQSIPTQYNPLSQEYRARVLTPGTVALMRDNIPPGIRFVGADSRFVTKVTKLKVRLSDAGKGVNEESIILYLNGKRICRNFDWDYDPDYRTFEIRDLARLRKGKNELRVKVRDYAGNKTEKSFHFKLK